MKKPAPRSILYADDIVLIEDSNDKLQDLLDMWNIREK